MTFSIDSIRVFPSDLVREAAIKMNRSAKGIALVLDEQSRLLGTVTDGDIRRAILDGVSMDTSIEALLFKVQKTGPYPLPVTAPVESSRESLLGLMKVSELRHIPLLDTQGRVVDVAFLQDLVSGSDLPRHAVVMAGGFGSRLHPLTREVPKPMLPVGDKPMLEHVIDKLREAGIHQVKVSTHYRGDMIRDYFGTGENFGIKIDYLEEDRPLGTAGALGLLDNYDDPILVVNADVLTNVDFATLARFHQEQNAVLTVGVRQYDMRVPFGVVECSGATVTSVTEKPEFNFFVNAGIYLIEPSALRQIERGIHCDMPNFISTLVQNKAKVAAFPIIEYWIDVGRPDDYNRAQNEFSPEKTP